jgi:hypothetical protein
MIPLERPKLSYNLFGEHRFPSEAKSLMLLINEAQAQNVVTASVNFCLPDMDCP